ncbi:Uncharacterised protein [Enterobacter cloacae]|nr:Uncharacterised protein [Enterobacter cloacae]
MYRARNQITDKGNLNTIDKHCRRRGNNLSTMSSIITQANNSRHITLFLKINLRQYDDLLQKHHFIFIDMFLIKTRQGARVHHG